MINLSDRAKKCLDGYLQQVRTYLRGCKTVDADEIERNVIEHIESEFESTTAAVSFEELNTVLQRLGSPRQWIPEEELPWWRKTIFRLRTGPEDWRLAYISFGLLILGFVILPSFVVLIPASFIVARAVLSETADAGELKSQRWLIYPSLIIVYTFITFWLILWPLVLLIPFAFDFGPIVRASYPQVRDDLRYWIMAISFIIAVSGAWWAVLGAVFLKWRNLPSVLLRPFGDWFNSKLALILLLIGLALMILSLGLGIWYWL